MSQSYGSDLRSRAVYHYLQKGGTLPEVAALFEIGASTLKVWVRIYRQEGRLCSLPDSGGKPSTITEATLTQSIATCGDGTSMEITAAYNRKHRGKNSRSRSSIQRALTRYNFVSKKNAPSRWSKSAPMWSKSEAVSVEE